MKSRAILIAAALFTGVVLLVAVLAPPGGRNAVALPDDAWLREQLGTGDETVLLEFGAEWCGPCQMAKPALADLEKEFAGRLKIVRIDVDERPALAKHYKADGIPLMLVLRDGEIMASQAGIAPPPNTYPQLVQLVSPHLPAAK